MFFSKKDVRIQYGDLKIKNELKSFFKKTPFKVSNFPDILMAIGICNFPIKVENFNKFENSVYLNFDTKYIKLNMFYNKTEKQFYVTVTESLSKTEYFINLNGVFVNAKFKKREVIHKENNRRIIYEFTQKSSEIVFYSDFMKVFISFMLYNNITIINTFNEDFKKLEYLLLNMDSSEFYSKSLSNKISEMPLFKTNSLFLQPLNI